MATAPHWNCLRGIQHAHGPQALVLVTVVVMAIVHTSVGSVSKPVGQVGHLPVALKGDVGSGPLLEMMDGNQDDSQERIDEATKLFFSAGGPSAITTAETANGCNIVKFGGYGGTPLTARLDRPKTEERYSWCPPTRPTFKLWPPASADIEGDKALCFVENIVSTTARGKHGNEMFMSKGIEVNASTDYSGGYDFRYGTCNSCQQSGGILPEADMTFKATAAYIENIVNKTKQKGSSGGSIKSLAFLSRQPLAWRKKFLRAYMTFSPVWGGSSLAVLQAISGYRSEFSMSSQLNRNVTLGLPSIMWLFPRPGTDQYHWNKTTTLVRTPKKNYTAYQLQELLLDMKKTEAEKLLQVEVSDTLAAFEAPMIDTYAFYGYGVSTPVSAEFEHNFNASFPGAPSKTFSNRIDDGDSVVTLRSTSRAAVWTAAHAKAHVVLENKGYKGMKHGGSDYTKDYDAIMAKMTCTYVPPETEIEEN